VSSRARCNSACFTLASESICGIAFAYATTTSGDNSSINEATAFRIRNGSPSIFVATITTFTKSLNEANSHDQYTSFGSHTSTTIARATTIDANCIFVAFVAAEPAALDIDAALDLRKWSSTRIECRRRHGTCKRHRHQRHGGFRPRRAGMSAVYMLLSLDYQTQTSLEIERRGHVCAIGTFT